MSFTLPVLPYPYAGLEPYIDAKTMELHHAKHHQGYIEHLNRAVDGTPSSSMTIVEIMQKVSKHSLVVRNHGGSHFNHSFFWDSLTTSAYCDVSLQIDFLESLCTSFGSFENFKERFSSVARNHFGSGWAWLSISLKSGDFTVTHTNNQDNPMMDVLPLDQQGVPLLGLDIWEHAYYLKYQNRRSEYIENFWHVVNWEKVAHRWRSKNPLIG